MAHEEGDGLLWPVILSRSHVLDLGGRAWIRRLGWGRRWGADSISARVILSV